jgi:UDP-glucose 4-epimerase
LSNDKDSQEKVLVTGGAGFIGSNLVDSLLSDHFKVAVFDNLGSGSYDYVKNTLGKKGFAFMQGDLLDEKTILTAVKGFNIIWHLAANPEVRLSSVNPEIHFRQNIVATYNLLEAIRKSDVKVLGFTSTSTVYGDATKIPTPEDYAPLEPISVYGASKLACEALVSAYANTYGFKATVCRLANVVGSRSRHGVIYDFVQKLRNDPRTLEILGDGDQAKSYLNIDDCIRAMRLSLEKQNRNFEIYNVGSEDQVNVKTIAKIVIEEMGLRRIKLTFSGGFNGGRGWIGDVKIMMLDVSKLKSLGWKPKLNSAEAIRKAAKNLLKELE